MLRIADSTNVTTEKGEHKVYRVSSDEAGQRIDSFLASEVLDISRSFAQKLIESGRVKVNGAFCKPSYELRCGDYIEVSLLSREEDNLPSLRPVSIPLEVLFEDDDIVVVNKPSGLVVHPGAGRENVSLVHGLLAHCSSLSQVGAPERPGIVHRLDEDTSGAIVIAKTDKAYWSLIKQFQNREVSKEYIAIVWNCPKKNHGEIRTCMSRHPKDRKKMAVSDSGREAITIWDVSKRWRSFSKLSVKILTGRTHQIRVHLAYIHHPIVGDEVYGKHSRRVKSIKDAALKKHLKKVNRQMLHAFRLSLYHPTKEKRLEFVAPLPEDMKELVRVFDTFLT